MQMHTGNQKDDVSLAKEFQHYLTKEQRKNGVIDQGKHKKTFMEIKWTDRQYHVQDNADVAQQEVRMYYNKNQFPGFSFCGPHSKPHGARGLSKHYHLRFDTKLGSGIFAIIGIPCDCVVCEPMLDKSCISGIPSDE